jgi:hypothetical protein
MCDVLRYTNVIGTGGVRINPRIGLLKFWIERSDTSDRVGSLVCSRPCVGSLERVR